MELVRVGQGQVDLSIRNSPDVGAFSSDERDLIIRCGQVLFHLKQTLQCSGPVRRVQLFPDLGQAAVVARVFGQFKLDPRLHESTLSHALVQCRRETGTPQTAPITASVRAALRSAGTGERAWLDFSESESSRQCLRAIAGSKPKQPNPSQPFERQLTFPFDSQKLASMTLVGLRLLQRSLLARLFPDRSERKDSSATESGERDQRKLDRMETLAVLKTKTDDRHGWLAAGQTLARVQLMARTSNVYWQVFDNPFQEKWARAELRTAVGRRGYVQVVLGFGSRS
jgi:hypothetical protein